MIGVVTVTLTWSVLWLLPATVLVYLGIAALFGAVSSSEARGVQTLGVPVLLAGAAACVLQAVGA